MKDELTADAVDDVVIDEVEAEVVDAEEIETPDTEDDDNGETPAEAEAEQEAEAEDGGLVVSLDDEEDEEVSQPFREVRQQNRELKKRLKELEASKVEAAPELGEKPKLEDFDYDTEKFETALIEWSGRKSEIEATQKKQREVAEAAVAEFQEKKVRFNDAKKDLGVKDYDTAEEVVTSTLPQIVQDIIIDNAKDPALMIYALGKNPKAMEKISKATTLREAVAAAWDLSAQEARMKVTSMKNKPKPETRVEGAKPVKTGDRQLEKLRAKAAQTGDFTEVNAYKKQMAQKK